MKATRNQLGKPLLYCTFVMLAAAAEASWLSRDGVALEHWLDNDVAPYLTQTLTEHPRFKGEPLKIVSMDGERLRVPPDRLSVDIVRRLTERLLDAEGISLVWSGHAPVGPCRRQPAVHYRLAVDVAEDTHGEHEVRIRALDLEDGKWVSGFGKQWRGRLSPSERRRFRKREAIEQTPGSRDRPFDDDQADLLAKQFAETLDERLCGRVGEPLRVLPVVDRDVPVIVAKTVALAGNYLAESHAITIVDTPDRANAELRGKLVAIDGNLHQIWLLLRPRDDDAQSLDLQAYVQVVDRPVPHAVADEDDRETGPRTQPRLALVTPRDARACSGRDPWRRGFRAARAAGDVALDRCFAIQIRTDVDAHVFLLAKSSHGRLVRLLPNGCDRYALVGTFVPSGQTLQFPSRHDGDQRAFTAATARNFESILAVTVYERSAARQVLDAVLATADFCGPPHDTHLTVSELERIVDDLGARASLERVGLMHSTRSLRATR